MAWCAKDPHEIRISGVESYLVASETVAQINFKAFVNKNQINVIICFGLLDLSSLFFHPAQG
jgi:hypothetical protein